MKNIAKIVFTTLILIVTTRAALAIDINTDPILNNSEANTKCPNVCSSLQWTGNWDTTRQGVTLVSVCSTTIGIDIPVGKILDDTEAQIKCPDQLSKMTWNNQWTYETCGCNPPQPEK